MCNAGGYAHRVGDDAGAHHGAAAGARLGHRPADVARAGSVGRVATAPATLAVDDADVPTGEAFASCTILDVVHAPKVLHYATPRKRKVGDATPCHARR